MTNIRMCQNNEAAENVVLIDVDSDSFNTINIDVPKNRAMKMKQGSKRLKSDKSFPSRAYIYIDDDGDVDDHSRDNTHFAKKNPVKLSRNKRMYPCRGSDNCYDMSMQSDGDSSHDDNTHDCEFVVDSLGVLEEWEIVSLKRKTNVVIDSNKVVSNTSDIDDKIDEDSVVSEQEKLKDTDEYKRALEEELLARERALKIQAEETQQQRCLLKRRKAEKMRLLDMQRRQKQRVEEIRESQKQTEEDVNLKEIYRVEVQQELKKLEMTCHDMASLLRGLGILVDNSPHASSHQVHAAYKRALLSFHPDRASGSDMRQKVEAEEKFKLISRMKDKVCNTPRLK